MAIAQDAYFIPDDIATGIYRRIGSVVRWASGPNKGQIVKHLKPIDLSLIHIQLEEEKQNKEEKEAAVS